MPEVVPGLRVETPVAGVSLLRLDRPDKRNALSTVLLAAVAASLAAAAADETVRCAVITGSDRVFAAGADLEELRTRNAAGGLLDGRPAHWTAIRTFPKPLVAAVEGWCLGAGNELLLCCDIAVAGEDAKFGQPETSLGIVPGAGGTATLSRIVGREAAMRMVLLGEPIGAASALRLGLVGEVVPTGQALAAALAIAERLAGRAPLALQQAKALVAMALEAPHTVHLQAERSAFAALLGTEDKRTGIDAFLAKAQPNWTGR